MKVAVMLAVGATAAVLAGASNAATLGFVATTTCVSNCSAAGLTDGQAVTARLRIDTTSFTAGGFLGDDDLVGFRVSFGGSTLTKGNVFGSSFFAEWGDTARDITSFSLQGAANEAPTPGPAFGISNLVGSAFTRDGFCENAACGIVELGNSADATPGTISAIPLPPALMLLASALAGLAVLGRRRT
jgi:hypothetical protein